MITVVIPVLNEAATIASVVGFALDEPLVEQVIVVDDASVDNTVDQALSSGAKVIQSTLLGKGASMHDGVIAARKSACTVFLDGDLRNLQPGVIAKLAQPVLSGECDFAKAGFQRSAGRITLLTVKPLLQVFFPDLATLSQPIGGVFAARHELLMQLEFEPDYGVDIGLLIDASQLGAKICEVDIGYLEHESQDLAALGTMARQVVRVILGRALTHGRLEPEALAEMREAERHLYAGMEEQSRQHVESWPVVLIPVDGVLLKNSLAGQLALHLGVSDEYTIVKSAELDEVQRLRRTVEIFKGIPKSAIETAARLIPLHPNALECVKTLRRCGFRVVVVGELFYAAADIIRKRIYADLCFAHVTKCYGPEFLTGHVVLSPAFSHVEGCDEHVTCNSNIVLHLKERYGIADRQVLAVGCWPEHRCLLERAGAAFLFNEPEEDPGIMLDGRLHGDLGQLVSQVLRNAPSRISTRGRDSGAVLERDCVQQEE